MTFQMNKNPPFEESELANTIGLLAIRSSHLDYLLRHARGRTLGAIARFRPARYFAPVQERVAS